MCTEGVRKLLEHIGILTAPDTPAVNITPASRWNKLRQVHVWRYYWDHCREDCARCKPTQNLCGLRAALFLGCRHLNTLADGNATDHKLGAAVEQLLETQCGAVFLRLWAWSSSFLTQKRNQVRRNGLGAGRMLASPTRNGVEGIKRADLEAVSMPRRDFRASLPE